jgi:hypothetical protein
MDKELYLEICSRIKKKRIALFPTVEFKNAYEQGINAALRELEDIYHEKKSFGGEKINIKNAEWMPEDTAFLIGKDKKHSCILKNIGKVAGENEVLADLKDRAKDNKIKRMFDILAKEKKDTLSKMEIDSLIYGTGYAKLSENGFEHVPFMDAIKTVKPVRIDGFEKLYWQDSIMHGADIEPLYEKQKEIIKAINKMNGYDE